ncbi:NAD-dependent epimerase/dehydratase family protein [Rhizobium sp. RU36D]|uniref:NAD-dependent epimerase/dehydratase family protein n=1 Tax=Rhizobium sp. RU36D TaxID=1907415 RepID=UPI0009D8C60E|nr:NAD-dependent epimerase/dehydratase family protein [Rhizobium sp. RU36D]SMC49416.1 Nucleoside-diphosphate-sugar epimerase [Rhizobium sp. RU36D]
MRILIIGAAGFIGSHLCRYFSSQGHDVVALCRSGRVAGFSGAVFKWALGDPIPDGALKGIDCVIHLAHDFDGEKGADLTVSSTLACIAQARAARVPRQLFYSSYSAGEHAKSIYGRSKRIIERAVLESGDVIIVRPGLVIGDGGLYQRIKGIARTFPIIPLPDGGVGLVPVITIERLCEETLHLITDASVPAQANIFERQHKSLKDLVLDAAAETGKRPRILYIPSGLVVAVLRLASKLRLPLPVNVDNLEGFLANQTAVHYSTLRKEIP